MSEAPIAVGDEFSWTKVIDPADVTAFGALVGDQADHHTGSGSEPLVVHGLLLMGMVSQLAAQFDFVGHEFAATFHAPSFTGQELTATMIVCEVETAGRLGWRTRLECTVVDRRGCRVLTGRGHGLVPEAAGSSTAVA